MAFNRPDDDILWLSVRQAATFGEITSGYPAGVTLIVDSAPARMLLQAFGLLRLAECRVFLEAQAALAAAIGNTTAVGRYFAHLCGTRIGLSANVQAVAVRDTDNSPVIRTIRIGLGSGAKHDRQQCAEH